MKHTRRRPRTRRTFRISCNISQRLGYLFFDRFIHHVTEGRLVDSLQTVSSLAPVALSIAPYLAAFATQHKDDAFLRNVESRFPVDCGPEQPARHAAWLTDTFTDSNEVTRTVRSPASLAKAKGEKLTVVTSLPAAPGDLDMDVVNFDPLGVFPLPEHESLMLSFPPFLEMIEYLERRRFSELIISTPGPVGLTGLAAARLLGIPVTGICHTDYPARVHSLAGDPAMEQLAWRFVRWFYGQMDHVIAPDEHYRRLLVENGLESDKVRVVQRGVDTQRFNPARRDRAFWMEYGVGHGFNFLYVGPIARAENLECLIEAFLRLRATGRDVSLILAGRGPDLAALRGHYRRPGILFAGAISEQNLSRAYASADVFVHPSTTDRYGNAVLEAHACGLPAIVADASSGAEIVRDYDSGLVVDVARPEALLKALDELSSNRELRRRMRLRALQNARSRSWNAIFDAFWNGRETAVFADETPLIPDDVGRPIPA